MDHADQAAVELTLAINGGDIPALTRLLAARPGLAIARITGPKGPAGGIRTPLHKLWTAAALGIVPRVEELLGPGVTADDLNEAFWQACHGGQRRAAPTPDTRREKLAGWLRERAGA